jgi:hypothetical protein
LYRLKIVICGLLVVGLNQSLLLCLADSRQKAPTRPMAVSCACLPTSCSCPPSNGCEHKHEKSEQKQSISKLKTQITVCRPDTSDAVNTSSTGWNVPILVEHTDRLTPYPPFAYIYRFYADSTPQQYPTPPDKPPQISFIRLFLI